MLHLREKPSPIMVGAYLRVRPHISLPHWGRLKMLQAFNKWGLSAKLLFCKSQRLESQPGVFRLLALVQTTRWTGGYDYSVKNAIPFLRSALT